MRIERNFAHSETIETMKVLIEIMDNMFFRLNLEIQFKDFLEEDKKETMQRLLVRAREDLQLVDAELSNQKRMVRTCKE